MCGGLCKLSRRLLAALPAGLLEVSGTNYKAGAKGWGGDLSQIQLEEKQKGPSATSFHHSYGVSYPLCARLRLGVLC